MELFSAQAAIALASAPRCFATGSTSACMRSRHQLVVTQAQLPRSRRSSLRRVPPSSRRLTVRPTERNTSAPSSHPVTESCCHRCAVLGISNGGAHTLSCAFTSAPCLSRQCSLFLSQDMAPFISAVHPRYHHQPYEHHTRGTNM